MSGSSGTSGTGGGEGGGGGGHRRGPGGLFDDLAGVAGGAFSVIAGLRQELDAALEVARRAREAAEALEARVAALEARLAAAAPAMPERGSPAVETPGAGGADSAA